ncbi:hypothetical protein Slin15195_G039880 [Septoria linicola]|uniref:Uncharacterized protein n=1 Tax=Septoria linicola TaxID=215465 RepID=A0A9Q9EI33_9PEZI|nr:hypothetical protein Slin15195_G039880 [Septoria linicola]
MKLFAALLLALPFADAGRKMPNWRRKRTVQHDARRTQSAKATEWERKHANFTHRKWIAM